MTNSGYGNEPIIDDPLAELERLVNERTRRMSDTVERLPEAPPVTESLVAQIDELSFVDDLRGAFDGTEQLHAERAPVSEPDGFADLLPSLAALRTGFDAPTEPAAGLQLDEFESMLGDAVADAMIANDSAVAATAAVPIEADVPPATHPIYVPDLPKLDETPIQAALDEDFERELADELLLIEEDSEPDQDPLVPPIADVSSAANDDGGSSRRRGWLVAAMLGGVAIVGGGVALTLGGVTAPAEIALIEAESTPHKVRPEAPDAVAAAERPNPVYERVAQSASAKVSALPKTEIVTSTEDVSNVRVATAKIEPKADDRLSASATNVDVSPVRDDAALGPRRVRTLKVGPDGKLVREDTAFGIAADVNETSAEPEPTEVASVAPTEDVAPDPVEIASVDTATEEGVAAPGIPLPRYRPANLVQASVQTASVAVASSNPINVAPSAPLGTSEWRVQIASVPDAAAARSVYARMSEQYASLLNGRSVDFPVATIENRGTFHRVQIETAGRNDANALCDRLKQAGGSCFVTR